MPTAEIAGRPLYYERTGAGPGAEPLLLVQGLSGHHQTWGRPLLELLEPRFDVIVYDHRGIGGSGPVSEPFTLRDLADDAAALLRALEIEDAHVMGISMGGMVAQQFALDHPEQLRTLTIGCSYCGGPGSSLTDPEDFGKLVMEIQSGDIERAIRAAYELNVSPGFHSEEHYAAFREIALAQPAPIPVIMLQAQAIAQFDVQALLGDIDAPTLVIHGTADTWTDPVASRTQTEEARRRGVAHHGADALISRRRTRCRRSSGRCS